MATKLEQSWYKDDWLSKLLTPLAALFGAVARQRRRSHQHQARQRPLPVPVIVVGNISVGGTGKTPLLISLVTALREAGYRPGVISRGYGGRAPSYPYLVSEQTDPAQGGDEPVLIASQCQCQVVVDPDRHRAAEYLLTHSDCNLIVSDDGLQHYHLPRDIEIAVIDGARGFGNGRLLPAGPLREPAERLAEVDFVVSNGELQPAVARQLGVVDAVTMKVAPVGQLRHLGDKPPIAARDWPFTRREVNAVAGIGNPQRFVNTLKGLGFVPHLHAFADHHKYRAEDLQLSPQRPIIMTAKDAVKCRSLVSGDADVWVLDVTAEMPGLWLEQVVARVKQSETRDQTVHK
ncbi:tetraacyldisaccharide 4'-kinase [Porticoccus sp. W117]|uniref:tetraacyldisaccharide 4'-kinase n=1 Tax=Porticoccus sp. W117 TaxID=3054777 RepID=UPI00259988C9|nr:tetraacyldisaccharide 4'-kinase [Porticoccus sp. W117]MDM3872129.1 tetraacyldisaccharide 4'-kinase [Porticoccus sp. W117]